MVSTTADVHSQVVSISAEGDGGNLDAVMSLQRTPAQIVRDALPAVDPTAPRAARSWEWICSALVNRDRGECAVEILDTVFVQREQIWSWFYSSSGGVVRKKLQRKLTAASVGQRFSDVARPDEANDAGYVAVCYFEDQRRLQLLTSTDCQTYLASCKGSACLSAFVLPRGDLDPTRYANLEYEFSLHKSGRLQGKLYRLAMGSQRIMSMDNKLNKHVGDMVQTVLSYVERTKKCRVVECTTFLVMDDCGRVKLWRTEGCQTIAASTGIQSSETVSITSYDGPHAVSERVLARAKAEAEKKPNDKLIQAILSSPTPASRRQTLLLQASASQPVLRSPPSSDPFSDDHRLRVRASDDFKAQLRNNSDWDQAMQFLPNSSSLSRGRKRSLSAAHLMSSQKKGCCGDFCELDVNTWSIKRIGSSASVQPPVLSTSGETGVETRNMTRGGRSSSVVSATMAASAFLTAHPDNSAENITARKPMSPQRQQLQDAGKSIVGETHDVIHSIPFKLIAQTRAEKQLVDVFIKRYQKGEDGDYLAEVYYGDGEPLGQTFPGYYYQEVHVCSNCFAFYTLVEGVRMKALGQLARRRSSSRVSVEERKRGSRPGRLGDLEILTEDGADIDDYERQNACEIEICTTAGHLWRRAWTHARIKMAAAITKKDAAELLSFVNPHPAVAMVVGALGILLLGVDGRTMSDIRRSLSQDKLLTLVQHFDLQCLQHSRVEQAASHARNPLFSPSHIMPISSCAARFCEWILSVLQAYAWKDYAAFRQDPETWELLAFLQPDLAKSDISRQTFVDGFFHVSQPQPSRAIAQPSKSTTKKQTMAAVAARKAIQDQQMARLSAPTGFVEATTTSGTEAIFTCADGITKIPYTVAGQAVGDSSKCNLVVFNDFFDTMESTKVFFRPLLARHIGSRALFLNLPGQAGSHYPSPEQHRVVFNNEWCAHRVHELLAHLQDSTKFLTTGLPFHIVGFGNGANIGTSFAINYGQHPAYEEAFQSLVLFNGFAQVDAQLSAILHSTVNVFSCFPPTRPDLPVTFFCKYLFSESYLSKIDANLALSIYTAVTNPITLDGRIRICQGALHHIDLTPQLPRIRVPLILVQSVENTLIAPTSVDPFLHQRVNIAHSWSHQQQTSTSGSVLDALPSKTKRQLQQVFATRGGAFVAWLRAGHELRQEAKHYVSDLLDAVVCSRETDSQAVRVLPHDSSQRVEKIKPGRSSHLLEQGIHCEQILRHAVAKKGLVEGRPTQSVLARPAQSTPTAPQVSSIMDAHSASSRQCRGRSTSTLAPHHDASAQVINIRLDAQEPASSFQSSPDPSNSGASHAPPTDRGDKKAHSGVINLLGDSDCKPDDLGRSHGVPVDKPRPTLPDFLMPEISRDQVKPSDSERMYRQTIDAEIEDAYAEMQVEEQRLQQEAEKLRQRQRAATDQRMEALIQEQARRRQQWEKEDHDRLAALELRLKAEQQAREEERQRRELESVAADLLSISRNSVDVVTGSDAPPKPRVDASMAENSAHALLNSRDLVAPTLEQMKLAVRTQPDLPSVFDQMEAEEKAQKRIGVLRVDDYDAVKTTMNQIFNHHVKEHESSLRQELLRRKQAHAIRIQKHIRRFLAVQRVIKLRTEHKEARIRRYAGGEIVRIVRGFIGRRHFFRYKHRILRENKERGSAVAIQRLSRGFVCRVKFRRVLRAKKAEVIQRVYRGHRGRLFCDEVREAQMLCSFQDRNAAKVQATWRMYVARDRFLTQRISQLAANEIQRIYRGYRGRHEAKHKKAWRDAEPGPERLALGLKMIEGSKQAFERQQSEIDALHRAQESVERQVSTIHADLQDSEKELAILERELQEIDQLEADLRELTHEAEILHNGGLEGILRSTSTSFDGVKAAQPLGKGIPSALPQHSNQFPTYEAGIEDLFEAKSAMKKRQADAFAVEMAIQIKRAEREKKKKDLEAEFTSVFAEVQQKRQSLAEMEEKLADMEATRMRKDREFARMQRNLMELLEEQKLELENLREKGIELETATATSAAAAAATAMKAKEHEKRSQAMFESTEELMKFQFMSMSLSYFSSLNMLKNLRDINADTTAAAITSTAETAAAAAAAAAAANIPTMKRLQVGGSNLMMVASQLKKKELEQKLKEEEEAKQSNQQPLPDKVKDWTVDDVGRWLDSLSLSIYKKAFSEGAVDGEFLLELRPEDMSDVLGVSHKLHVRKIIVARNRLLPLSQQEQLQIAAVEHEEQARNARQGPGSIASSASGASMDLDTVFSQARNGRMKRLVESVDAGFDINAEDEKGNTLLLIACQNVNIKMVEYLVAKRASVNHKNAQGNTPLHFAMAYDTEGKLGEYLIAHGADDTIENTFGLTAYDGLQPE